MTHTSYGIFDIQANFIVKTGVLNCTGSAEGNTKIQCNQVINAIGQSVDLPPAVLKDAQHINLATIEQTLEIPVTPGRKKVYKFIPQQGELTGKTVYIAFENVVKKPGEKDFGTLVIKMYRYVQDIDAPGKWTEFGNLKIPTIAWRFSVSPDAIFTSGPDEFTLGKKDIKPN
jgi:hypothetical protein